MNPSVQIWRRPGRHHRTKRPAGSPEPAQSAQAITERIDAAVSAAIAEFFPDLWRDLTEIGRKTVAREVTEALMTAPPDDRDLAANEVMQAWQRTWLVRQAPGYAEAVERAGKTAEELGEPVYTIDQLRERIGL
jgi:acyl-CoA reductase-like NAD-dependent aldehyde dehydrogenase